MMNSGESHRNQDDTSRNNEGIAQIDGASDLADSQRARTHRQDALSAIARAAAAVSSEVPEAAPAGGFDRALLRTGRKRTSVIVISVLLALALLVAGVYGYQRYITNRLAPIPRQLRIDLTASKLYCPEYIAWSPDSLSLAVIADAQDCNADTSGSASQPDQALAIYNARTGALEKRVGISSTLSASNLTGSVTTVGWSRDGSSVYVICAVQSASGQTGAVALIAAPIGSARAQLYASSLTEYPQAGIIWDLHGRFSASALSQPLPPALAYSWSSGGIVPSQPFSQDLTGYTGTTNQASGRGGFSFWQPGTIVPIVTADANSVANQPPFALIFDSQANQDAPDGASFASSLPLYGRLQMPKGTGSAYNRALCTARETKDACLSPVVPYADKALAIVAGAVEQGVQIGGGTMLWYPASVAWRPDGAFLAALLPADGFNTNGSKARITIYNASTGAIVAHFTTARTFTSGSFTSLGVSPVQWSQSGQQIALVDFASSAITVWDARGL